VRSRERGRELEGGESYDGGRREGDSYLLKHTPWVSEFGEVRAQCGSYSAHLVPASTVCALQGVRVVKEKVRRREGEKEREGGRERGYASSAALL
jgi:hypothetical protein